MSRSLSDLDSRFKPLACELIARAVEAGIQIQIVDTLRTPEEQAENLRKGVSKTANSKHLPQPPEGKALAIDIAPFEVWQANGPDKIGWDIENPAWRKLGAIGEALGLRWGGRFGDKDLSDNKPGWDPGHFEFVAGVGVGEVGVVRETLRKGE